MSIKPLETSQSGSTARPVLRPAETGSCNRRRHRNRQAGSQAGSQAGRQAGRPEARPPGAAVRCWHSYDTHRCVDADVCQLTGPAFSSSEEKDLARDSGAGRVLASIRDVERLASNVASGAGTRVTVRSLVVLRSGGSSAGGGTTVAHRQRDGAGHEELLKRAHRCTDRSGEQ